MDYLSYKIVTTRKPCTCYGCARVIPAKSQVRKTVVVDGGTFFRTNWCSVCREYWSMFMGDDEEIGLGELKTEDPDRWESIREQVEDLDI